MYLDVLELSIASSMLKNKNIVDGTYNILENGNICLKYNSDNTTCEDELKVEVKGKTPESGSKVVIKGSEVVNKSITDGTKTKLIINNKPIVKNEE